MLTQVEDFPLKKYDKWDDVQIINFLFPSSYIPYVASNGDYISQLQLYTRECSQFMDFIYRSVIITQKLLQKSYEEDMVNGKFYGHHN